jgi:FKBP-type peptidyl-prolyl cis-trans isomerase (trigger factor)
MLVTVLLLGAVVALTYYLIEANKEDQNEVVVTQTEYTQATDRLTQFLQANQQTLDSLTIESDVSRQLLDRAVINEYAENNNISVNSQELTNYYEQRVLSYENEAAFLEEINRLYDLDKQKLLQEASYSLLREKVQESIDLPLSKWLEQKRQDLTLVIK